jgi:hypothetical protein
MDKGKKFDEGKLEWDLIPIEALEEVVKVLMMGKEKYGKDNWKKVDNSKSRYYNAGMRHRLSILKGESTDQESGLHHLAHSICNDLFLLWGEKYGNSI